MISRITPYNFVDPSYDAARRSGSIPLSLANKKPRFCGVFYLAEREGFEPSMGY